MSTRGVIGFRKNGKDKLSYEHYDSYPSSLGEDVLKVCKMTSVEAFHKAYDRIKFVTRETLTPEVKQLLMETSDMFKAYVDGESPLTFMVNNNDFIKSSLFCEWGYIVNLDNNTLEIWKGMQKRPTANNRYGQDKNGDSYYPCKLVAEFPLDNLPSDLTKVKGYN